MARLCFWVPPEQQVDFAPLYERQFLPLLRQHDLAESAEPGRPTVPGVSVRAPG